MRVVHDGHGAILWSDITNHVYMHAYDVEGAARRYQICLARVSAKQPWYKGLELKERANVRPTHGVSRLIMSAFARVVSLYHLADLANNDSSITA